MLVLSTLSAHFDFLNQGSIQRGLVSGLRNQLSHGRRLQSPLARLWAGMRGNSAGDKTAIRPRQPFGWMLPPS
jgi:hypothetical protein